MKKITLFLIFFLFTNVSLATSFKDFKENRKISYLDFILLKIEQRLIQRHGILGAQPTPFRIQYQSIGSQVDFLESKSQIAINIIGTMDKSRYTKKKYVPKISDCNILRNLLLYGKYGYNFLFQKRNKFLTYADMEDIFISRFLNNLSLSEEDKNFILDNTIVKVEIIDPVRGRDISCTGKVAEDLI